MGVAPGGEAGGFVHVLVADVQPAGERHLPVADKDLAVVAKARHDPAPPDARRQKLRRAPARPPERIEQRTRAPRPECIHEKANLHPGPRLLAKQVHKIPSRGVVLQDEVFGVDMALRGEDRLALRLEGLHPADVKLQFVSLARRGAPDTQGEGIHPGPRRLAGHPLLPVARRNPEPQEARAMVELAPQPPSDPLCTKDHEKERPEPGDEDHRQRPRPRRHRMPLSHQHDRHEHQPEDLPDQDEGAEHRENESGSLKREARIESGPNAE